MDLLLDFNVAIDLCAPRPQCHAEPPPVQLGSRIAQRFAGIGLVETQTSLIQVPTWP